MSGRIPLGVLLALIVLVPGIALAQHGHGGGGGHHGGWHHGHGGIPLAAAGGGYAGYWYGWPYFVGGPGYYPYYPMMMTMGPAGFVSPFGALPPPMPMRGPVLPQPPPRPAVAQGQGAGPAPRPGRPPTTSGGPPICSSWATGSSAPAT